MSHQMVEELLSCFQELADEANSSVRVAVIQATGKVFCAGGDVHDLAAVHSSAKDREAVAVRLDELLTAVNEALQVTVMRIQGPALGGGLGLVCVSDIAIASASASFALPEVRLGLLPSVISPYLVGRCGLTRTRQLMLTGRAIPATTACDYGLVSLAVSDEELDSAVASVVSDVLKGGPRALRECKRLLFRVVDRPPAETVEYRASLLDEMRKGGEAREGMLAFLEKRPAPWMVDS
jgi:methylglutaconyl-CoA hydratase